MAAEIKEIIVNTDAFYFKHISPDFRHSLLSRGPRSLIHFYGKSRLIRTGKRIPV
jgi:hypothetical protein